MNKNLTAFDCNIKFQYLVRNFNILNVEQILSKRKCAVLSQYLNVICICFFFQLFPNILRNIQRFLITLILFFNLH